MPDQRETRGFTGEEFGGEVWRLKDNGAIIFYKVVQC